MDAVSSTGRMRIAPYPETGYVPHALSKRDWCIAGGIALLAGGIALFNILHIEPAVYRTYNIFFQADPPRVIANMTDPTLHLSRNATHPLFAIFGLSAVRLLGLAGIAALDAMRMLVVGAGAVSAGAMFLALRGLGLPMAAAIGFIGAFVASACFLHWYAFIETFAFAGLSTTLMVAAITCLPARPLWTWAFASAGTLAMTTTNWAFGLVGSAARLPWRDAAKVTILAFALVAALALIQKKTIDHAWLFFDPRALSRESNFTGPEMRRHGQRWEALASIRSALITTAVVPPPITDNEPTERGLYTIVTNQFVPVTQTGGDGRVAIIAWVILLVCGCWGALVDRARRPIGLAFGAFILMQVALHAIYGEITFLYSADFMPAMIGLAALGWFSPLRRLVVAALALFVLCGAVNNETQFLKAATMSSMVAQDKTIGRAFGR